MNLLQSTLAIGLLFGALPASAAPGGPPPLSAFLTFQSEGQTYEELNEEYLESHELWQEDLSEASKEERRTLRAANPVHEFWDRFVDLSAAGNGQAKFWLCDKVLDKKFKTKARGALLAPLFQDLVKHHSNAEWFAETMPLIHRHRRALKNDVARSLYNSVVQNSEQDESRAAALFFETRLFKTKTGAEPDPVIAANLDRILADFPDTTYAVKVRTLRAADLSVVGAQAPDFVGKSIDDFEFKLSDYKGKVVLLDFYGFW